MKNTYDFEDEEDNQEEQEKQDEREEPRKELISPEPAKEKKKGSIRRMTQIQIVACALLLLAAFVLRFNGGSLYNTVRDWYFVAVNDSILPSGQAENIKHTVVDLWSSISNARPGAASSKAESAASSGLNGQVSAAPQLPQGPQSPANSGSNSQGVNSQGSNSQSANSRPVRSASNNSAAQTAAPPASSKAASSQAPASIVAVP